MRIYVKVIVMDDCRIRAVGTKSSIEDMDPELAGEWRIAALRRENNNRSQRTAKDRWSLIRLVSRIGINVRNRQASDGSWITDRDAHVVITTTYINNILTMFNTIAKNSEISTSVLRYYNNVFSVTNLSESTSIRPFEIASDNLIRIEVPGSRSHGSPGTHRRMEHR